MKDKLNNAVDAARPYAERIAKDDELHDHVKNAYESARRIYDELLGDRGATGTAMRVARDKDIQDELRRTVQELRKAGDRVQKGGSHSGRNMTLLLTGIALGILFNPMTGAETRRWIRESMFGAEKPFEQSSDGS
jgi:hypothetical protein